MKSANPDWNFSSSASPASPWSPLSNLTSEPSLAAPWSFDLKRYGSRPTMSSEPNLPAGVTRAFQQQGGCARRRIAGLDATREINLTKVDCSRRAADDRVQLHGTFGYMKKSAAGRAFVYSRLVSIKGGSDETMIHSLDKNDGILKGGRT